MTVFVPAGTPRTYEEMYSNRYLVILTPPLDHFIADLHEGVAEDELAQVLSRYHPEIVDLLELESRSTRPVTDRNKIACAMKGCLIVLIVLLVAGCQSADDSTQRSAASPYVGEESREIKALSADEIEDLLEGEGLGYAKAAELNGYPGPRHVLDLADSLGLSDEQRRRVDAAFVAMREEAQAAGRELIQAEARLDSVFAAGEATPEQVREMTAEAARIESRVRNAHLQAHLETTDVLDPEQVHAYMRLRGYGGAAGHSHDGDHRM